MRKKTLLIIIAILTVGVTAEFAFLVIPSVTTYFKIQKVENENEKAVEEATETPSAYLEVPFICQAPLQTEANWVHHEESCEEAAVLQAYLYENDQQMSKEQANEEILEMIDWQMENFGSHHDIYADEIKQFITGYYYIPNDQIDIVYDADLSDIRRYIAEGHPVIVPTMGNVLKNPYYPHPGYHMLVAIGYTESRIITNDNGTRRGADFSYDNQTFLDAMTSAGGDIVIIKTKTTTF